MKEKKTTGKRQETKGQSWSYSTVLYTISLLSHKRCFFIFTINCRCMSFPAHKKQKDEETLHPTVYRRHTLLTTGTIVLYRTAFFITGTTHTRCTAIRRENIISPSEHRTANAKQKTTNSAREDVYVTAIENVLASACATPHSQTLGLLGPRQRPYKCKRTNAPTSFPHIVQRKISSSS